MKVLLVHNFYRSSRPSGENLSVEEESLGLLSRGVDVKLFERQSDHLAALPTARQARHAASALGASTTARAFDRELATFAPDVVHLENVWPMISPVVIRSCRRANVPTVASIRNFRLSCIAGTHFRKGEPCYRCDGRNNASGVVYSCYQDSKLRSIPVAIGTSRFAEDVRSLDAYLPTSEYMRRYLLGEGVPDERIIVRPNAVPDPGEPEPFPTERVVLFLGRLSEEKGITDLLGAWASTRPAATLRIAGDGDQRPLVEAAAAADPTIDYIGQVGVSGAAQLIASSSTVVVPSRWAEPFGRVAIEAFAHGRPVIGYRTGGLAEVLTEDTGWPIEASPAALARALDAAALDCAPSLMKRASTARQRYLQHYRPEVNLSILLNGYRFAIERATGAGR